MQSLFGPKKADAQQSEAVAKADNDGEGNEEGGGWQARAILVNLGELPVKRLYAQNQQQKGAQVNIERKPIWPCPTGRANAQAACFFNAAVIFEKGHSTGRGSRKSAQYSAGAFRRPQRQIRRLLRKLNNLHSQHRRLRV